MMQQHKQRKKEQYLSDFVGYGSITGECNDGNQIQQSSIADHHDDRRKHFVQIGLLIFGVTLLIMSTIAVVTWNSSTIRESSSLQSSSTAAVSMVAVSSTSTSTVSSNSDNPVIDILQQSSTIIHPQSYYKNKDVDEFPSIYIDLEHERQVYNGRTTTETTSLTISWTNGQFHTSSRSNKNNDILSDDTNDRNIIALLCGDSEAHLHYMDAKYISAVSNHRKNRVLLRRKLTETGWYYNGFKNFDWWGGSGIIREKTWRSNDAISSSSSSHSDGKWHTTEESDDHYEHDHTYDSDSSNNNVWYFASVPQYILDQRKCQAILYYYIHDNEYVLLNKSKIIRL